jgi:hypothetical protein
MLHCRSQEAWLRMGLEESLEGFLGETDLGGALSVVIAIPVLAGERRRPELARAG